MKNILLSLTLLVLLIGCEPIEGLNLEMPGDPVQIPFLNSIIGGFSRHSGIIDDTIGYNVIDVDSSGIFYRIFESQKMVSSEYVTHYHLQTRPAGAETVWSDFLSGGNPVEATCFSLERSGDGDKIHVFFDNHDSSSRVLTKTTYNTDGAQIASATDLTTTAGWGTRSLVNTMRFRRITSGEWFVFISAAYSSGSISLFKVSSDFSTIAEFDTSSLNDPENIPGYDSYDYVTCSDMVLNPDGTIWISFYDYGEAIQGFAVFNTDGTFNRYVGGKNVFRASTGFDFASDGTLYVHNAGRRALEAFSADGGKILARSQSLFGVTWEQVVSGDVVGGVDSKAYVTVVGTKVYVLNGPYAEVFSTF